MRSCLETDNNPRHSGSSPCDVPKFARMRGMLVFNMKYRVIVKSITPCSCENEGEAEVYFPDFDLTIVCYFIGSIDWFKSCFPLNKLKDADLRYWHANWQLTDKQTKSIATSVVGTYGGFKLDEDNEKLFMVNSLLPVISDNELGNYQLDVPEGSWVESTGQFVIEEVEF